MTPTAVAVVLVPVGVVLVLRAVAIITNGGRGRLPFDPTVSRVGGFALLLGGQALRR